MTPHQVISLLTQEQTRDLVTACAEFLDARQLHVALREGLDIHERQQLAYLLSLEFELGGQEPGSP